MFLQLPLPEANLLIKVHIGDTLSPESYTRSIQLSQHGCRRTIHKWKTASSWSVYNRGNLSNNAQGNIANEPDHTNSPTSSFPSVGSVLNCLWTWTAAVVLLSHLRYRRSLLNRWTGSISTAQRQKLSAHFAALVSLVIRCKHNTDTNQFKTTFSFGNTKPSLEGRVIMKAETRAYSSTPVFDSNTTSNKENRSLRRKSKVTRLSKYWHSHNQKGRFHFNMFFNQSSLCNMTSSFSCSCLPIRPTAYLFIKPLAC